MTLKTALIQMALMYYIVLKNIQNGQLSFMKEKKRKKGKLTTHNKYKGKIINP